MIKEKKLQQARKYTVNLWKNYTKSVINQGYTGIEHFEK